MPRSRFLKAAPLLAVALALIAAPSRASLLVPLGTADLVARAERIVVGVVEGQSAHWVDEGRTAIVTDVRVRVQRAMLGAREGEVITVRRLGGTVDGVGMRVYGEASYAAGEEVLLFCERRGADLWSVGMTQGKLHISTEGGRKMAQASLQGAALVGGARAAALTARPLDEVLKEVSGLLQRRARPAVRP